MPIFEVASLALRVRSYLLLIFGFYVCGFHLAFITVHMPAYLIDLGFSAYLGALSISIIGFCNIFGAYYAGVASNSFSKRKLLITIYLGRAIAITCFFISSHLNHKCFDIQCPDGISVVGYSATDIKFSSNLFWNSLYVIPIRYRIFQPSSRQFHRRMVGRMAL